MRDEVQVPTSDGSKGVAKKPASRRLTIGVWDLPTRLFHWALVVCVVTAWVTGGSGSRLHEAVGYCVAGLVVYRLIWGVIGTRYAQFRDFVHSPFVIVRYLRDVASFSSVRHIGHNPAGGAMIIVLIADLVALSVTGAMMQSDAFFGLAWVEEAHTIAANALLLLIPLHLVGVLVSSLLHEENLVTAMITGRKARETDGDGASASVHSKQGLSKIVDRVRGVEGLVILIVCAGIGTVYGWNSTAGRQVITESAPPAEAAPTVAVQAVSQMIRDEVPVGVRQDYVAGGPALASQTWLISSGGRLYDNWFKALGREAPAERHPAWTGRLNGISVGETWRCKSCHGWDYMGGESQLVSGNGATGFPGIRRMRGRSVAEIIAVLASKTHQFSDTMIPPHAKYRLALFVARGQHTASRYISGSSGRALNDAAKGAPLYQNICAACHGFDGKTRKLGISASAQYIGQPLYVGTKANANPVEVLHKIRNGHPGAIMISMRALPIEYSSRLLAYVQTLPTD